MKKAIPLIAEKLKRWAPAARGEFGNIESKTCKMKEVWPQKRIVLIEIVFLTLLDVWKADKIEYYIMMVLISSPIAKTLEVLFTCKKV